jgi:hypothetical protein
LPKAACPVGQFLLNWLVSLVIDASQFLRRASLAGGTRPEERWRALMQLMLTELHGCSLPPVGTQALGAAEAFWNDRRGSVEDLLAAKINCWTYLDGKNHSSTQIADDEDRALRALLCVLEPIGDQGEASDSVEWFAEMLNGTGK